MKRTTVLFFSLLLTGIAAFPFFFFGYPAGSDWPFELIRTKIYAEALYGGQIPPHWAGNLYGGYGSPIFLYYPPLFLFVAAMFQGFSVPVQVAIGCTALIFFACAVFGILGLSRAMGLSLRGQRMMALLYVLNPYLLSNFYLRNACAEFTALCLAPFAFLGLMRMESRPLRGALLMGSGMALIILAHNLTALVIFALLWGGGLVLSPGRWGLRTGAAFVGGIALSLFLSAFHWVPAFFYRNRMRLNDLTRDKFQIQNHFADWGAYFDPTHLPHIGPVALAVLFFSIPAALVLLRSRRIGTLEGRLVVGSSFAAGLILILFSRESLGVWERVPLLALFQFPWRLLGPLSLLVAVLGGLYFSMGVIWKRLPAWSPVALEVLLLTACVANALFLFQRVQPLSATEWESYEADYEGGATVYNEYVPRGALGAIWRLQPLISGPLVHLPEGIEVEWVRDDGAYIEGRVLATRPVLLAFGRWAVPEWKATIGDRPARWLRSQFGTVLLPVPPGSHRIRLELHPPPLRRLFWPISLAAFAFLLGALLVDWRRATRVRSDGHKEP